MQRGAQILQPFLNIMKNRAKNFIRISLLLAPLTLMISCGSSLPTATDNQSSNSQDDNNTSTTSLTFNNDIAPIFQQTCMQCHQDGGIAPFPLTTYEETAIVAPQIKSDLQNYIMPPFGANNDGSCQEFQDANWLGDQDRQKIIDWIDGGMPKGDESNSYDPPAIKQGLDRVDLTVKMTKSFIPVPPPDDDNLYQCFVVDTGLTSDQYIVGYEGLIGNKEILHHMLLFIPDSDMDAQTARSLDPNGDGYECYGGPSPSNRTDVHVSASPAAIFAPGTPSEISPDGTGISLPANRPVVLQIHYHMDESGSDPGSGFKLKLVDPNDPNAPQIKRAFFKPLLDTSMKLPDGQEDTTYTIDKTYCELLRKEFHITDKSQCNQVHGVVAGVFPHEHERGLAINLHMFSDQQDTCMINVPHYQFNWQRGYFYDGYSIPFTGTDKLELKCHYNTVGAHNLGWGDGTEDEMCLAYMYFYQP